MSQKDNSKTRKFHKKGSTALALIAIILAIIILAVYLVGIAQRDCNSNKDCPENAYCGTDYECHDFPQQILVKEANYVPASIIFGISLIIAAYVYRGGKIPFVKKKIKNDLEKYN
ncbi:MAG TPA: hypothetical protein VJA23_01340 [Candidatus Nanoarchaeia archaeon]|nr:hypothetical protein [Candidatus Nanoarchaeia archaeon]